MQSLIAAGWLPEYLSLYTLLGLVALAGLTKMRDKPRTSSAGKDSTGRR